LKGEGEKKRKEKGNSSYFPEYMKTNLRKFCTEASERPFKLSLSSFLLLAVDIAKGMNYLHLLDFVIRDMSLGEFFGRERTENRKRDGRGDVRVRSCLGRVKGGGRGKRITRKKREEEKTGRMNEGRRGEVLFREEWWATMTGFL
jgi:hypothetical protein